MPWLRFATSAVMVAALTPIALLILLIAATTVVSLLLYIWLDRVVGQHAMTLFTLSLICAAAGLAIVRF